MENPLSLTEIIRNAYSCKTDEEAFSLAMRKADLFQKAREKLVDVLFEYLRRVGKVSPAETARLEHSFVEDTGEKDWLDEASSLAMNHPKGLALPAFAIGRLAIELYPDTCQNTAYKNRKFFYPVMFDTCV